MKTLTTYLIATAICAGYLNSFNQFLDEPWKMPTENVIGRSIIWPWTLGEILCGMYIGENWSKWGKDCDVDEPEDSPEDSVEPSVFEGALKV